MIHTAGHIDMLMPHRMAIKINSALNRHKKSINGSRILFLGVAYKPDIADDRESPALKIIDEVVGKGGIVEYYDPYIPAIEIESGATLRSVADLSDVAQYDCVVVSTKHSEVDYEAVRNAATLIVDLQNAFKDGTRDLYKL
jgi:UDP-N-acetyl-D-glucosamine dehydrogenase